MPEVEVNLDSNEVELEVTENKPEPVGEPEQEPEQPEQATEGAEETPEETPEQAEHKRKTGSQREKEKAQRLAARVAQLEAQLAANQTASTQTPHPQADGRPQLAQFDTVEEYLDAEFRYREAEKRQVELKQTWEQKAQQAKEKYEDFDDVTDDFIAMKPPQGVVAAVMESDHGTDLIHYLGSNPTELRRIAGLSAVRQAIEIGKLETNLAEPKKTPPRLTKAPPPISPVKPVSSSPIKADKGQYIEY